MNTFAPTIRSQQDFEQLFLRSQRRAYNLAYRLTGNATDAEDVTQDAYVRAWRNFETYDSTRSFEGWLFRIITNRVIDLRRRQKRVPMYSLDAPIGGDDEGQSLTHEFAAPNSNPENIVIDPILDVKLDAGLRSLPTEYREALLLCDVYEKSYMEIAESMGCAIGTVRSRIHRARTMLRKFMESDGTVTRRRRKSSIDPVSNVTALAA